MPLQPLKRTEYRTGILPAMKETLTLELGRIHGNTGPRADWSLSGVQSWRNTLLALCRDRSSKQELAARLNRFKTFGFLPQNPFSLGPLLIAAGVPLGVVPPRASKLAGQWRRTRTGCPPVCAGLLLGGTSEKVLTVLPSTDRVSNAIERARSTSRPLRSGPVLPFPNGHA